MGRDQMGGKSREHWEQVAKRLVRVVLRLDQVRGTALRMTDPTFLTTEDIAQEAADDIDAILDAMVVLDYEFSRHFGESPEVLQSKKNQIPVQ